MGMTGCSSPFDPEIYTSTYKSCTPYEASINFLWQKLFKTFAPWVPIDKTRVLDRAATLTSDVPSMDTIFVLANFTKGQQLPKGGLQRLSPDEPVHANVFRIAQRLRDGCSDAEAKQWLRQLLSTRATFKRLDSSKGDISTAESNALRMEISGLGEAVTYTGRQIVHNVNGLKLALGKDMSAAGLAAWWSEIRYISPSMAYIKKKVQLTLASQYIVAP